MIQDNFSINNIPPLPDNLPTCRYSFATGLGGFFAFQGQSGTIEKTPLSLVTQRLQEFYGTLGTFPLYSPYFLSFHNHKNIFFKIPKNIVQLSLIKPITLIINLLIRDNQRDKQKQSGTIK